jgi:hypothetical protein
MSALKPWRAWIVLAWLTACASPPLASSVRVSVVDDRGEALAEVPIALGARVLAHSDVHGAAQLGQHALAAGGALRAQCPQAYRSAKSVALSHGAALPRRLQFVCRPRLRTLAVVAYAPGAQGAMLRADQQALGRVAADGTLHAVVRRAPGASFTLALEGGGVVQAVSVRDRDELIFFDATRDRP